MLARFLPPLFLLIFFSTMSAQIPAIEPGVPQTLARWRAAHYSDVRYKLNLTLEKMSPVLKGTIEIRVNLSVPPASAGTDLPPIILDWRKIRGSESLSTVSNLSINGRAAKAPPATAGGTDLYFEERDEHLVFRDGVVAGENVIKLDFTSPILTSGSAITRYVDKEDGSEYIYSLFVPSDASTAFPVFDQPDLKAKFTLNLEIPNEWTAVSNSQYLAGPAFDLFRDKDVKHTHRFFETKPISTYVFAFAAGPWEEVSEPPAIAGGSTQPIDSAKDNRGGNATVRERVQTLPSEKPGATDARLQPPATAGGSDPVSYIYVRKSQAAKFKPHSADVFRLNRDGIKFLEEYFDYKFPFPKYDLVLIPEFPFGGMEHAGATFLREDRVIFPTEPTKNDYITRANLIFHEAAHQWFGDTVTMRWFDDLWLKEGFAEFMAYKTLEKVTPEYNAWKVFYERNKQAAYLTDSTKGTTPIYQEIPNLSAAKSAYGNIVYRKAPSFLKQAEFYIGPDKFQTAVRAFLKKHEFGNAEWSDLVRTFETASRLDLKEWGRGWVTQRGMPIFRAELYKDGIEVKNPENKNIHGVSFEPKDILGGKSAWTMKVKFLSKYKDGTRSEESVEFDAESARAVDEYQGGFRFTNNKDPLFVFPNYQDYGYGIFLLDDKSRDYVLKNIQNEKDDFLRTMMWGSLWDSVREAELDPKEYVELVINNINAESDESTIQTLLGRVSTAMTYYIADESGVRSPHVSKGSTQPNANVEQSRTIGIRTRLEAMLIDKMRNAPTMGQKITYYRALLNIASTENARNELKRLLTEGRSLTVREGSEPAEQNKPSLTVGPLPLKTKDRFDIVTRLLILNDPDAPKLLADLEKTETSDEAKRYAYAAKAGIATADSKAKFWDDFVNNKTISESWIESAFGPFNSVRHADLTLPYLERSLKELPNHKRNRKIFFVNGWLAAFIGGQRSEEALNIVNKFLADNPDLDRDLRLKILENVDVIERAVKIRNKFAK